jgi:hypothetical protein
MGERIEPGDNTHYDRIPLNGLDQQLIKDIGNMPDLRRMFGQVSAELISIQNRMNNVQALLKASAEHKLPFGLRFHAHIGKSLAEVWRKDDNGEYTPRGYIDMQGEDYPFIADSIRMIQIGGEEGLLLTNESFNIGISTFEIDGTLLTADIETEVLFADFYKFIELAVDLDDENTVALSDLLGPTETPQA